MKVYVEVYSNPNDLGRGKSPIREYVMNHNDQGERRVLGEQCRNAFEAGQLIVTYAWRKNRERD